MKKLIRILQEAIPISQYRDYHQIAKSVNYQDRLKDWFNGKWRIYLPFKPSQKKLKGTIKGEVEEFLDSNGYTVTNYILGYCKKKNQNDTRIFNIGKILNLLHYPTLLSYYNNDPARKNLKTNYLICISRHPYDIIGMSTNRGWSSCMSIDTGCFSAFVKEDIKAGTLIAYLIKDDDKNIKSPIARTLIKPYISNEGKTLMVVSKQVYGEKVPGFIEAVKSWLNSKQKGISGIFKIHKQLYLDKDKSVVDLRTKEKKLKEISDLKELKNSVINSDKCKNLLGYGFYSEETKVYEDRIVFKFFHRNSNLMYKIFILNFNGECYTKVFKSYDEGRHLAEIVSDKFFFNYPPNKSEIIQITNSAIDSIIKSFKNSQAFKNSKRY